MNKGVTAKKRFVTKLGAEFVVREVHYTIRFTET